MNYFGLLLLIAATVFFDACKTSKKNIVIPAVSKLDSSRKDTIPIEEIYQTSAPKIWDLIHTKLDVSFDWKNCHLLGKATITLKPHFYKSNAIQLDAIGFSINDVSMLNGNIKTKLNYVYNEKKIQISLPKSYSNLETLILFIDYVAKPNSIKVNGSEAITSDKGLYFINPTGEIKNKPQQIWTQGETQASSCWFPTIDAPNQRMTQEISITVDKKFMTLSNGLLVWQQLNEDSTRTDIWKQSLSSAPYLAMMVVGNFAEVKDTWNKLEVSYFVEPAYKKFAKQIFGNTPEMLTFFSKKFGIDYPWEKYAQIVVRDYVSGAMENTSATLHGEFIQKTDRELLDGNYEDYIAHELTHQWFGDLVTCESWSNLTLNEGFATYGEYLWMEYKYGKEEANYHLFNDLQSYLGEARQQEKDLIRFNYDDKEDMFDSHSYAKGARVIHMLRNIIGDDAFFASIKLYLEKNKFQSVEAPQLRLAFEEVTGLDLNWFFNQWFYASGHPNLNITYEYNDTIKKQKVIVEQTQNLENTPLYQLPVRIDVYNKAKVDTHFVTIKKQKEVFLFDANYKPDFVVFDVDKVLISERKQTKTNAEWIAQYNRCPNFIEKYSALHELEKVFEEDNVPEIFAKALTDKNEHIRNYAVGVARENAKDKSSLYKNALVKIALKDEKSIVRANAIDALSHAYDDKDLVNTYKLAIDDASFAVEAEALKALFKTDKELGVEFARTFETDSVADIVLALCNIYAQEGEERDNEYFSTAFKWLKGGAIYEYCKSYSTFLLNRNDTTINKSLIIFEKIATTENAWYIRLAGYNALDLLKDLYQTKKKEAQDKIKQLQLKNEKNINIANYQKEMENAELQHARISSLIRKIKSMESDKKLVDIYSRESGG